MKKIRKILSISVFTLMLCAVLAFTSFAAEIIDSGSCGADGDNVTYTLDSDGVLTISGEGKIDNVSSMPRIPEYWQSYSSKIKAIVIEEGITEIGINAFDAFHVNHDLSAMEKLFAGYINARLDTYLKILQK